MPKLLSGSTLRRGGSGAFIDLKGAQPQLPATETTLTGFTIVTDGVLNTSYKSSLGFIEFTTASIYSALPQGTIRILATGSTFLSTSTTTGNLVIQGGVGIGGNMYVNDDIVVNGLTLGTGYEGKNNLVFRGIANTNTNVFEDGENNIAIGYDVLTGIVTADKVIAIGRGALSSGTNISNTIAIGDNALGQMGTQNYPSLASISGITFGSSLSITAISTASPAVVTSPLHGLTTGTQILITDVNGLSTSSGGPSEVNNVSLWIDDVTLNSFSLYENKNRTIPFSGSTTTYNGSIVTLTNYVSSGTIATPIRITALSHNISTSTRIYIDGISGTTQLNQRYFYVESLSANTLTLYNNSILESPETGVGYTAYSGSGTIYLYVVNDNNIALGMNVAPILRNGDSNFFFGNNLVTNMVTGSNNTFIGHNVGGNLKNVNGTIALGGDNLVDNRDNQVNIGSVFYYDGGGNTDINSDVRLGLGTESTGTDTGALVVLGGMGIKGSIYSLGSGVPEEDYLVYTPKITITTGTVPPNPRLGDIWINTSIFGYLQYIQDGTSTIWLQIVQL